MDNPLANALLSDSYAESTGLENEVERPNWRNKMRPDYESEPPPVTLGEDGNYYANDNRWNYGEWVTIQGTEPVYYVEGGVERDKVDDDQWEYDENGNVITKDADFSGNGKALNPSGQWLTESQIRDRWDSDFGMANFRKANPNMSVDDYLGLMKETTALKAQGIERLGEGGVSAEYQALYDKYGLETSYTGSDGAVYEWNGGGYTITQNGTDMGSMVLHGLALGILGAGMSAGLAPALSGVLGQAGGKAASSAITSLVKQYMTTGNLSFEDALMSAALSYGGSELADALNSSGVVSDLASQFDEITSGLVDNGGDILKTALQAGGMSLVTQLVNEGEIDWKDAAIAAAMAGGTTALQGFLADIGKSDAEDEVLQEISVDAQRKGTQVGDGLWQLDDGTVISDTGNVLGNMSNLDLDGDGLLNANDLSEIDVNHDYVDPNYEAGDGFYDKYPVPDSTESPTAFTKEWADERYGALSEDQTIAAMERDGFTDKQIEAYVDGRYDDIGALNPNLVTHAGGWVENMEQPYTLEYRDGRHYIIMDGKLKAISEEAYTDLYADLESGGDWQATMDRYGVTHGGNTFGGFDEHGAPLPDASTANSDWITLDGTQPTVTAPIDDFVEEPVDPVDPETPVDPNNENSQSTSNETTGGNSGATGTDGDAGTTGSTTSGLTTEEILQGIQDGSIDPLTFDFTSPLTNSGGDVVNPTEPVTDSNINPTDGTGTPTPPMNARVQALMDKGMSYEQAVANQNAAIRAGADADGDGMVTDAEWSAHKGNGSGETNGGDNAGNDTNGDNNNNGDNNSDSNDTNGTDNGGNGGDNTGDNSDSDGPGNTDEPPGGGGPGPGPGNGPGNGGPGAGLGVGVGMLGGAGDNSRPVWGQLFAQPQFRRHTPYQSKVTQSLFGDLMGADWLRGKR